MFDRAFYTMKTNNNYNQLVDHLVTTMPPSPFDKMYNQQQHSSSTFYSENDEPFDTPAYSNYQKSLTKKERKSFDELYKEYSAMSIPEQITNLKVLGRELVIRIDDIIDKLDVILNDDFDPNRVTCSVDNKEVDCDTWDEKDSKS